MTRSFVALVLDDLTRAAVSAEIERLRPLSAAVAWIPAPNLHVTLKFLGDQSEAGLARAAQALCEVGGATGPFSISLFGLGAYPGMERPRILWVGVANGAVAARALQSRVEAALERQGFARDERAWHPHLTIGRVFDSRRFSRQASPTLREALARAAVAEFGTLPVPRIVLMRSDLAPSGARYRELHSVDLTGG